MSTAVKELRKPAKYDCDTNEYDKLLEPDEDFYSAISADEFKKRALEVVERVHKRFSKK